MQFLKYLGGRLVSWVITIYVGVTFMFFIPRLFPADPVEAMIQQMLANVALTPHEIESIRATLYMQFGLYGTLWEQYLGFLRNVIRLDFGPSLMAFPRPASEIVFERLPYSVGLSLFVLIIAWVVGNLIGMFAGFRKDGKLAKALEWTAIVIYPIPVFIMALCFQILFSFILGWFPITTVIIAHAGPAEFWSSLLRAAILPASSMILVGFGWWIISMKAIAQNTAEDDFVRYARFRGISEWDIGTKYVFKNSILPQVSAFSIAIGGIFGGTLFVEMIFQFPGVGMLAMNAIQRADYNLIMATATISIFAVSTATLIADLIYPFIDPRIRYR